MKTNRKERNIGVDLLRCIAMILVVTHHFLGHGLVLETVEAFSLNWYVTWLVKIACYTSVTVFYLIAAYYQSQKSLDLKAIIKIWLEVQFYSVLCYFAAIALKLTPFTPGGLAKAFCPLIFREYGFFNGYFLMAILSPYVSQGLNALRKRTHATLILCLTVLVCVIPYLTFSDAFNLKYGEGALWICLLYCIGAYLAKYPLKAKTWKLFLVAAGGIGLTYASKILIAIITNKLFGVIKWSGAFVGETQILMLIASCALFVGFMNLDRSMKSRTVRKMIGAAAPLLFAVFLIHENNNLKNALWTWINPSNYSNHMGKLLVCYVVTIVIIFLPCMIIEFVRSLIERKLDLSGRLSCFIQDNTFFKKIRSYFDSCTQDKNT